MRIGIITPAPPGSNYGNRVTAVRWAKILRKLSHQVSIAEKYDEQPFSLLIALHARRSSPSITRWRRKNPDAPLAWRLLPLDSRIGIVQIGRAMTDAVARQARREMKMNRRYSWLGKMAHARALRRLAGSDLCVISSRMEGGANVLSEAIVAAVPALASPLTP